MSSLVHRNDNQTTNETLWLELSDRIDASPAAIWALDDDDDEITIQSKPARSQADESVEINDHTSSSEGKAPRKVRVLDESQVLPGEASFATVKLNQEIERNNAQPYEWTTSNSIEEATETGQSPYVRVLDESRVLPGEASFATVMVDTPLGKRSYSPVAEFLLKTNFSQIQLLLGSLFLVSVVALAAIVVFKFATSNSLFDSPATTESRSNPSASTEPANHADSTNDSKSRRPEAASISEDDVFPTQAPVKTDRTIDTSKTTLSSDESRMATYPKPPEKRSDDVKAASRGGRAEHNSKTSGALSPSRSVINSKTTNREKSDGKDSDAKAEVSKPEPLPTTALPEKPKEAPATPVTGGGQRPRRVTP